MGNSKETVRVCSLDDGTLDGQPWGWKSMSRRDDGECLSRFLYEFDEAAPVSTKDPGK